MAGNLALSGVARPPTQARCYGPDRRRHRAQTSHRPMLRRHERHWDEAAGSRLRLQTAVRLRWFGVIGQLLTVGVVYLLLGFQLPLGICLAFIALSAWLNVFLRIRFPARTRLSTGFATSLLAYDILQLAALLFLT